MPPRRPPPTDAELVAGILASRCLVEAPSHLLARADAMWRPRDAAARPRLASLLKRLHARLASDSGLLPPLVPGLRSAQAGPRQLVFSADGVDIDLRVVADGEPGRAWLHGQVFADGEGGAVWIRGEAGSHSAAIDGFGEFRLGPLEAGDYQLGVERDDWVVELPGLALPAGRAQAADDGDR